MEQLVYSFTYEKLSKYARENPVDYWDKVGKTLHWFKPYSVSIENPNSHKVKWFVDGKINITYNCLHKALEDGCGDSVAIIHENINQKTTRRVTYQQMYDKVAQLAGLIRFKFGLSKGDSVLMYMPLIPEGIFVMLACALLGVTYCPVFGGFPAKEVSTRINCFKPKLVITSNIGYKGESMVNYNAVIQEAMDLSDPIHTVPNCLILNRPDTPPVKLHPAQQRCHIWNDIIHDATPYSEPEPLDPDHPSFYIFTSGSTGKPKGLVMPTSLIASHQLMNCFGEKFHKLNIITWMMSDLGWIVGQTALSFHCFLSRNGSLLYEGPILDKHGYSDIPRVLQWHKVASFLIPPVVARQLCITGNQELLSGQQYPHLKVIITGGELIDAHIFNWIKSTFKVPVYAGYGQTELGGGTTWSGKGYPGGFDVEFDESLTREYMRPLPNANIFVVDELTGQELAPNTTGKIVIKLPITPGLATTLYGDDDRFYNDYFKDFPGFYDTKDIGQMTKNGLLKIQSRSDDILKVSNIKINCGHLEALCTKVKGVMDAIVIGIKNEAYGEVPFVYLILNDQLKKYGTKKEIEIISECSNSIKERYGNILHFRGGVVICELPLTFTGKKNRRILKDLANKKENISLQGCRNMEAVIQIKNALLNVCIIEE